MNTPQNQSAQNSTKTNGQTIPKTPKLNPDFSHRLGFFDSEATSLNLTDAVDTLAKQADAVISMLENQFLGDENVTKFTDDVVFWTLESVRATVNDINAIVAAYHEANRAAEIDQGKPQNDQAQKSPQN